MKCFASRTICSVDRLDPRVAMTIETLLLTEILRPLMPQDNALGSYGVDAFARIIAERLGVP